MEEAIELLEAGLNKNLLTYTNDFTEYFNIDDKYKIRISNFNDVEINSIKNVGLLIFDEEDGKVLIDVENTIEVLTTDKIILTFFDDYANVLMTLVFNKNK